MLLLEVTGLGAAELVMLRSAWPAVATTMFEVALLLLGFGSVVDEATVAVSVMRVPAAVPAPTVRMTVNVVEAPEATLGFEQDSVPATTEQVQPATGEGTTETNVVLAGIASLKTTLDAVAAPLFLTTTVYVMLEPARTGLGVPELVMDKSAVVDRPTVICTVAELLARTASLVPEVASMTSVITVPEATPVLTATPSVKVVEAALATSALVQEMAPVPPTVGVIHVQPEPAGLLKD